MDNQLKELESLSVNPEATKKELQTLAVKMSKSLTGSPFEAYAQLKRIQDLATMIMEELKPVILEDMEEDVIVKGAKLSPLYARRTYDFSHCDVWNEVNDRKKQIEGLMKSASQNVGGGFEIVDEDTGETIPAAKINMGTPSIKVTY